MNQKHENNRLGSHGRCREQGFGKSFGIESQRERLRALLRILRFQHVAGSRVADLQECSFWSRNHYSHVTKRSYYMGQFNLDFFN